MKFFDGFTCRDDLLGRGGAHWSFFHDTDGSVMEGNDWPDTAGPFVSGAPVVRFSKLDQYLMGLRDRTDVPPFFHIADHSPVSCFTFGSTDPDPERSCAPQAGVTVSGTRRNVTVDQVIQCAENGGARVPATGFTAINPSSAWRQAFVLVVRPGADAAADVQKLETIRAAWVSFFESATGGRGRIATALRVPVLSVSGPGDFGSVPPGATAERTLTVTNTGDGTLAGTVTLGASTPAAFTIVSGGEFSLAPGASHAVVIRFTAPQEPGALTGSVEVASNGGAVSHALTARVVPPPPDLVVTDVTLLTPTIRPRSRLAATVRVSNQGGAAGAFTLALYLSRDPRRDLGDVPLGPTRLLGGLASGVTMPMPMTAVVPRTIAPGDYFVVACADDRDRVAEGDETNNCLASASVVTVPGPDLVVGTVESRETSVAAGDAWR